MDQRATYLAHETIIRWANSKLCRSAFNSIGELLDNDSAILVELLTSLSEGRFVKTEEKNVRQKSRIYNFLKAEEVCLKRGFKKLKKDLEVKGPHLFNLLNDLMLHYSIKVPLKRNGSHYTLDPETLLLLWINCVLGRSMRVRNFTSSWRDGRALGALLNSIEKGICPGWQEWDYENGCGNIKEAMDAAKHYLFGVDTIINPGDMCQDHVSSIVIITYLSQLLSATVSYPGKKLRKVVEIQSSEDYIYYEYDEDLRDEPPPLPPRDELPPLPPPNSETIPKSIDASRDDAGLELDTWDEPLPLSQPNSETIPKSIDASRDDAGRRPDTWDEPLPLSQPNSETIPTSIDASRDDAGRRPDTKVKPTKDDYYFTVGKLDLISGNLKRIYDSLAFISFEFEKGQFIHQDGRALYSKSRCVINEEVGVYLTKFIAGPSVRELEEEIKESHDRRRFKHENIVELIGLVFTNNELYTIMPKMDNGFLQDFIYNTQLDMSGKLLIANDVAKGLEYIHSKEYVLQKLTLYTCTVSSKGNVKIMDLSCLSDLLGSESTKLKQNIEACYKYMPDEIFSEKVFYQASDVYVYAVFVWTIFNPKNEPYGDDDIYSVISAVASGKYLPQTSTMNSGIYRLLLDCWQKNRAHRPDFTNVISRINSILLGIGDYEYDMIEEDSFDSCECPI